jgi:uncharacterized protein (TIGR02217 family)
MADFLEEVLYSTVKYGSSWYDEYSVSIDETAGGQEYRSLTHPFPKRTFTLDFELATADMWPNIINLYHRAHGTYAGFRAWCIDEDSSNGSTSTPTMLDQTILYVSSGIYQLIKRYGTDKSAGATGYPYRHIKKPISGSVVVAKNGTLLSSGVTVDTTTGRVTITPAPLISDTITAGFRFHFPVRFKTALEIGQDYPIHRTSDGVEFIELLNP